MYRTGQVVAVAAPFVWLGMVLSISFLETPLKFRAPGITLPLGLGIGRLVFRALNRAEVVLAALLTAAYLAAPPGSAGWVLLAVAWLLLAVQVGVLRPRLDRRTAALIAGQTLPASRHHVAYIALEGAKVIVLVGLGGVVSSGVLW
jgi:hypothetical protein